MWLNLLWCQRAASSLDYALFEILREPMPLVKKLQSLWKAHRRRWLMANADVHLISFPKCGRTWLVLMISKVIELHYGVRISNPLKLRNYRRKVRGLPLILQHHDGGPEFQRVEELERDKGKYAHQKVIFLVRDPRDVTVSAYFQKTKRNYNFSGTLEEYVYEPVGSIATNIEFYNIWARNRSVPKAFLLVTYEGLHRDPEGELKRVIEFAGIYGVSNETIRQAVEACRFDEMRKLEASNALRSKRLAPRDPSDQATYKTREGRVGGFVRHLQKDEIAYINDLIEKRLDNFYAFYKQPDACGVWQEGMGQSS